MKKLSKAVAKKGALSLGVMMSLATMGFSSVANAEQRELSFVTEDGEYTINVSYDDSVSAISSGTLVSSPPLETSLRNQVFGSYYYFGDNSLDKLTVTDNENQQEVVNAEKFEITIIPGEDNPHIYFYSEPFSSISVDPQTRELQYAQGPHAFISVPINPTSEYDLPALSGLFNLDQVRSLPDGVSLTNNVILYNGSMSCEALDRQTGRDSQCGYESFYEGIISQVVSTNTDDPVAPMSDDDTGTMLEITGIKLLEDVNDNGVLKVDSDVKPKFQIEYSMENFADDTQTFYMWSQIEDMQENGLKMPLMNLKQGKIQGVNKTNGRLRTKGLNEAGTAYTKTFTHRAQLPKGFPSGDYKVRVYIQPLTGGEIEFDPLVMETDLYLR